MSDSSSLHGNNSYPEGPLLSGPLLGEVGPSDAFIWVQARDTSPLALDLYDADGKVLSLAAQPAESDWLCTVFHVEGLRAEGSYSYSFSSTYGQTERYPLRKGLPNEARRIKLALGSCYKDYQQKELPIFSAIAKEAPDLFLMLGDNCYFLDEKEWNSESGMMMTHLRHRNHDSLRPLVSQVPVLGIWDDHDFGPNDSDGTFENKAAALRCFARMWAQRSYGTPELPGIFSTVRCGPVELFLLDDRYYRRERQQILGAEQLGWLKERLRQSQAPVKLVLSGSQVLPEVAGMPHFNWECWRRDAAAELEELLSFIEQEEICGVLFASGDPHLGYVLHARGRELLPGADRNGSGRRGPELFELTTSPLAHTPWPEHIWPADSREPRFFDRYLLCEMVGLNYGVIDIDLDRTGEELRLQLKDPAGGLFYDQAVALGALKVRPASPKRTLLVYNSQRIYMFKGKRYVRADLPPTQDKSGPLSVHEPRAITAGWPGVFMSDPQVDAVLMTPHGKAYFFSGNGYVRYDIAADQADPGYPKYIARHFAGVFADGLDAAAAWTDGKAYFFRGGECIRYDLAKDRADPGYPKSIAEEFPGVWPGGIDTAALWPDGTVYFLRENECIRYDLSARQPQPGYPRPIAEEWPDLP